MEDELEEELLLDEEELELLELDDELLLEEELEELLEEEELELLELDDELLEPPPKPQKTAVASPLTVNESILARS